MTTTPLTDQQLADIQARADAATKGPWGYYDGDNYAALAADYQQTGRGSYSCRQGIARLEEDDFWDDQANEARDEGDAYEQMIANAEFITHAREDVPALLAELGRVRAELAGARAAAFREAARVLEHTGRDDDAVNLLDNIADGIVRAVSGCGCTTRVHPGHYPSCPAAAVPSA